MLPRNKLGILPLATGIVKKNWRSLPNHFMLWFYSTEQSCTLTKVVRVKQQFRPALWITFQPFNQTRVASSSSSSKTNDLSEQLSFVKSIALQRFVQLLIDEHRGMIESGESASLRLAYLTSIVEWHQMMTEKRKELDELNNLIKDLSANDEEMLAIAKMDVEVCEQKIQEMDDKLLQLITPLEPLDKHDIIVEVTAGIGGLEAMLFARRLFDMYQSYACFKGWDVKVLLFDKSELDGMRHGSLCVSGFGAYTWLKFEGGIHRVQRVPLTEKSGRIHTSTVTVAIMPQPKEIQVDIKPKDIKVETKRASGPGGQHVNKTDSAVRITHLSSGIVVESQSERSQIQNKAIALQRLQLKLYQCEYEEALEKHQAARRIQVGTSRRSEKIRTYNYVQDRITDHRIGTNIHRLHEYLSGGKDLDHVIEQLMKESQREIILETISKYT